MAGKNKLFTGFTMDATRSMLMNYMLGRFEWEGLPLGLTSRQLEYFLCFQGLCVGFRQGGFKILPASESGEKNLYFLPVKYIAYAFNQTFDVDKKSCVEIHNNSAHSDYSTLLETTADKLNECLFAANINVKAQKNPWVFGGTQDELQSVMQAVSRVNENGLVLYSTKQSLATLDNAKRFFPMNTQFIASDLYKHYREILNNFLTLIGMDNVPIEKKERLISDEAHSNDSAVLYNRNDALKQREQAANELNAMFGTSIKVKWVGCEDCKEGEKLDEDNIERVPSDK